MKRQRVLSILLGICFFTTQVLPASATNIKRTENQSSNENIMIATSYDTSLMAYQAINQDMPAVQYNQRANYFRAVSGLVRNCRHATSREVNYVQLSKQQMINELASTEICFVHSHGAAGMIQIGPESVIYTYELASADLSDLKCVLLLVCKSGATVTSSTNLVQTMVNWGADSAVGFTANISIIDSNLFAEQFARRTMDYGETISAAINNMPSVDMEQNLPALAVIRGNSSTTLNN